MARHKKGKAMMCGLVHKRVAVREARDANPGAAIERHGGDYLVLRVGRQETWGKASGGKAGHGARSAGRGWQRSASLRQRVTQGLNATCLP